MFLVIVFCFFFFFNDTATTEIYTLSLHDALPIWTARDYTGTTGFQKWLAGLPRSEEHTSELQSPCNLVCRLLLEKKKTQKLRGVVPGEKVRPLEKCAVSTEM